jgi:hypothetical protein
MAILKAQGLQLAIGTTLATAKTMSAVTNATEGVATLESSHGVVENDIIIITSGWKRLNGRVVRADSVATNDVTLEDVNTSSTTDYPAAEGAGSIQEVTAWTTITQLMPDVSVSGGGFRKTETTEIDDVRVKQVPILAEAVALSFKGHADPSLSWYTAITAASRAGTAYPYRITLPSGAKYYGSATVGFNPEVQIDQGILVYALDLDLAADSIYYSS